MPRRLLKRLIPDPHTLRERWFLRPFGARLADPLLWTLHRRGVTHAFGAGLAICFVPLPVHLLLATSVAVIWRLNIPVICGTTFLLNPFTAVPAYYLAYRVGAALLHVPRQHFKFVPNWHWFGHSLAPDRRYPLRLVFLGRFGLGHLREPRNPIANDLCLVI